MSALFLVLGLIAGAYANTHEITCAGERARFTLALAGNKITRIHSVSAHHARVQRDLLESNAYGFYGPVESIDPEQPLYYEGEFTSPHPRGRGQWTITLSTDFRRGYFVYDDDDGYGDSFPVSCVAGY